MIKQMLQNCSQLNMVSLILWGIVLAVGLELITIWARFGLGLESTRDTSFLSSFTLGIRIHHGYIGLLILMLSFFFDKGLRNFMSMVGIALVVSDLIHHFLVLWPITGKHDFDIFYKKNQ